MQSKFFKIKLCKRLKKYKIRMIRKLKKERFKIKQRKDEIETKKRKKKNKMSIILLIFGIIIFFYPLISKFIYQKNLTYTIDSYIEKINDMEKKEIDKQKNEYEKYNKMLLDESLEKVDLLKIGEILGYIQIDKINVYLPIYEGTDDNTLHKGIGHLEKSSLPTKKYSYHSILVGHTGISTRKFFDDLPNLKVGDDFVVTILNEKFKYKIYEIKKVLPHQTKDLKIQENRKLVTLVTCTPKFVNSHRLLVMGKEA